jgi:hypothetical protein
VVRSAGTGAIVAVAVAARSVVPGVIVSVVVGTLVDVTVLVVATVGVGGGGGVSLEQAATARTSSVVASLIVPPGSKQSCDPHAR